jgi:outer membrane protein OmpA-like peptidoglycan-associated protein
MIQFHKRSVSVLVLASLTALGGCASDIVPRELKDAREAYKKAQSGPASELALAQLETAKQALRQAEEAFQDGDDENIPDYAYLAERKSQLAQAAGELEQAGRERAQALEDQKNAREEYQRYTEKSLTAARKDLEQTRRDAEATKAKLREAESRAAAALASLKELASVKEEKRGMVITLSGSVLFATGRFELLALAQQKLTEVAHALKDEGFKSIVVEGHTDSRGAESANQRLSEQRANAVRSHMISQGIESAKITAVGLGEARPVASNSTTEGRANNRRVEIIVQPED